MAFSLNCYKLRRLEIWNLKETIKGLKKILTVSDNLRKTHNINDWAFLCTRCWKKKMFPVSSVIEVWIQFPLNEFCSKTEMRSSRCKELKCELEFSEFHSSFQTETLKERMAKFSYDCLFWAAAKKVAIVLEAGFFSRHWYCFVHINSMGGKEGLHIQRWRIKLLTNLLQRPQYLIW